ncbi:MAG: MMPL family transporter, partial [Myxococcales bacterium]|nr:MMPL family transporter [Myxococcales bacterium]
GIFLLLMWAFRSWKRALVALMPISIGTVVSLGALWLLYRSLDPITSSFAAVLMGLGIDFSVHLLARYDEDLRAGGSRGHALFSALRRTGPGVVTGAVTTALAFLTIATTEFTSYAQMGVITAIGLLVSLLVALLLLPVALGRGDLDGHEHPKESLVFVSFLPRLVRRSPFVVVLGALALAMAGTVLTPDYNPRYLEFLPKGAETTRGLETLEEDGVMSPWFAWATADDLEQARERTRRLRAKDMVGRVESPTDLLPELTPERLERLQADFAGVTRAPDWAKLEARKPDPAELAARCKAIVDALDELAFAAEQAGRDGKAITDAKQAFADLQKRLESVPAERGAATLDEIENEMAKLLGPAWTTASAVAERGHWIPADLPDMFENRFVARDGSGRLAMFVYPASNIGA